MFFVAYDTPTRGVFFIREYRYFIFEYICYAKKMNNENIPEYDRIIAFDQDINDSRANPVFIGKESEIPEAISKDLIAEAESFLGTHEIEDEEKLNDILHELATAIAINNDPRARALHQAIEKRYRKDAFSY